MIPQSWFIAEAKNSPQADTGELSAYFFRLTAAFNSLSCSAPHTSHTHSLMFRIRRLVFAPQAEHSFEGGQKGTVHASRDTLTTPFPSPANLASCRIDTPFFLETKADNLVS